MANANLQLEAFTRRTSGLYSLPAVAMEVLRLTENTEVDASALKGCIEKDPALTAKVLRVVNSGMYGLRSQVGDLNQALAILGVKPLEMLVLGFSLPEAMFEGIEAERLSWYWTRTLTRAVAARQLSETLWNQPGDEALVAGLLQDVGVLALLQELRPSYANFLTNVIVDNADLSEREREALGFENKQLSASLLLHWKLPQRLVEAIAMPRQPVAKLAALRTPEAELAKILHLADLVAQLLGGHRLQVLPDLMEIGALYRELTRPALTELLEALHPQVNQLADVLSLQLPAGVDYGEILGAAQARMNAFSARNAEEIDLGSATGSRPKSARAEGADALDTQCEEVWNESQALSAAMEKFLQPLGDRSRPHGEASGPSLPGGADATSPRTRGHAPHARTAGEQKAASHRTEVTPREISLPDEVNSAARGCRMRRRELSLILVELEGDAAQVSRAPATVANEAGKILRAACHGLTHREGSLTPFSGTGMALVVPDCDRPQAVAIGGEIIARMNRIASTDQLPPEWRSWGVNVGAATVASVPKNFESSKLIESAERCLGAARSCSGSAVKSIEIY